MLQTETIEKILEQYFWRISFLVTLQPYSLHLYVNNFSMVFFQGLMQVFHSISKADEYTSNKSLK